ncbi:MAG TPA: GNAT family N-acetyltransferase [Gaiellaceae bacterium]
MRPPRLETTILRPPTLDDAPAVAALISARDEVDFAEKHPIDVPGEWLREWWAQRPERLDTDARIALVDGTVVGYAHGHAEGSDVGNIADESCVHPDFRGRGIGSQLVAFAESWALDRKLPRLHMHAVNDDGRQLFEERGFELVRFFWRMEIDLEDEPPRPDLPSGFLIRTYEAGADDQALHAMHQEAFPGHWEFTPHDLESWLRWRTHRSDYDPDLWQLVVHEDEIAGAALGFGDRSLGWVLDLAVGPRWPGVGWDWRFCMPRSARFMRAGSRTSASRSTPRTRRARRGSTSAPE